jgi:hypothetical protein
MSAFSAHKEYKDIARVFDRLPEVLNAFWVTHMRHFAFASFRGSRHSEQILNLGGERRPLCREVSDRGMGGQRTTSECATARKCDLPNADRALKKVPRTVQVRSVAARKQH